MNDENTGMLHGSTTGGVAGKHPELDPFQVLVGSSTTSEFNTARLRPIPIACWRVDDVRFYFESSAVLPDVKDEMRLLAQLIAEHTEQDSQGNPKRPPPISLFGHADPVGNDVYNKLLSGRRAAAIYGVLTRRDEVWEDLFSNGGVFAQPVAGDNWGTKSIQMMLNEVAGPVRIDGTAGPETHKAVRDFQSKNGLAPDGNPGPATRKKLFLAYMDKICMDAAGNPFRLDKVESFLARNEDAHGKGDFQGCGEFNPALIFSQNRNEGFERAKDKKARNEANALNRRVVALLFRPGSRVLPAKWPCPLAKEGGAGCVKRFFSDGEARRSARLPDKDRKFNATKDTFACRFYDRLSNLSPCENVLEFWLVRLLEDGPGPLSERRPLANQPYTVTGVGGLPAEFRGTTDARGVARIPVRDNPAIMTLRLPGVEVILEGGKLLPLDQGEGALKQRLSNLGFGRGTFEDDSGSALSNALSAFQLLHGLPASGQIDDDSRNMLQEFHGS